MVTNYCVDYCRDSYFIQCHSSGKRSIWNRFYNPETYQQFEWLWNNKCSVYSKSNAREKAHSSMLIDFNLPRLTMERNKEVTVRWNHWTGWKYKQGWSLDVHQKWYNNVNPFKLTFSDIHQHVLTTFGDIFLNFENFYRKYSKFSLYT